MDQDQPDMGTETCQSCNESFTDYTNVSNIMYYGECYSCHRANAE